MAIMTERNNRSWINDDKRIRAALQRHQKLMRQFIAEGLDETKASRKAYLTIRNPAKLAEEFPA